MHHHDDRFILFRQSTMIELTEFLLIASVSLVAYVIYHFFIKIYIQAWRFQKMDSTLKVFVAPFYGLLGLQKQNIEKYGDSHKFIKTLIQENPDQRAYFTNIGSRPFLILCDALLIKELSLNPKKYRKFNLYKHSNKSYLQSIFLTEDEDWAAQKTIIRHSFNHEKLKQMIPPMQKSIDSFAQRLKEKIRATDSKSVDFKVVHDTECLIGQILVRIFFSEEAITKKLGDTPLSIALAEFTTTMFQRSRTGANILLSLFFGESVSTMNFTSKDRDLQKMLIDIRKIIVDLLDARLALQDDPQKDFIQHYIQQMRTMDKAIADAEAKGIPHKLRRITKEQIMQQLIGFYFAGIDTTGHLVAFAIYALGEYPQCRQKIIQEVKTHIKTLQDINYENLQKLQYTGYFLDECLRMWPPATGILARVTREEVKVGPYTVPKGMLIGTNIIGLMHNPKYYNDPDTFNPDRWATKGPHTAEPYSFIPFSAGTRSCIGKYLALMETKMILIKFLNEFDFARTQVPLRLHAKFLYEPIEQDLIRLKEGGMQLK